MIKSEFDADLYYDALDSGPKEKTIGIAVNEDRHAFYHEYKILWRLR